MLTIYHPSALIFVRQDNIAKRHTGNFILKFLLKTWLAQGAQNNACDENYGGCDVSDVKFSTFIQPLVQAKCQGCHSGSTPQGGIKLTSYAEIQALALDGRFYGAITRSSNWMPKGGSKLDACNLQKIQAWISAGAPQN